VGPPVAIRPPRLVLRFALYSALALLLAGVGILWFVRHEAEQRARGDVADRAELIAGTLSHLLRAEDFAEPPSGRRRDALEALAEQQLANGVVGLKLWSRDGTLLLQAGRSAQATGPVERDGLERALRGEDAFETTVLPDGRKMLEAFVQVRFEDERRPVGVIEIHQDYSPVAEQVSGAVTPVAVALGLALVLLYGALFPILRQVTAALHQRNRRLADALAEREDAVAGREAAESRYRTLIEQLPLVTYIDELNESSSAIYISPQAEALLDYPIMAWLGDREFFPKILHPEDRERVLAQHREAYAAGRSFSDEYRLIAKDGHVVWVRDELMVVRDEQGRPKHAQGFLVDVTDRKEAESALRESEEKFRTLVANLPGVVFRCAIDSDWTMELISDVIEEISGYPASDFIGNSVRTFASIVHPDDAEPLAATVDEAVRAGRVYTTEYRILAKDGSVHWVLERGLAISRPDGSFALDGAIFDITESKRAEEAIKENEAKFRAFVETTAEWVWAIDLDGRHTYANPAVERILGYTPEELVGQSAFAYMHPEDRERIAEELPGFIERKEGWSGLVVRWLHKDGSVRQLESNSSPIISPAGELLGWRGSDRDVTEAIRAEAERERLLADLGSQNERLLELDSLKDEFIALVSHELRTPLTSIRGYLELLLEGEAGELTQEQQQFLGVVERNAHRLLHLVGDLLFLAQLEAGKLNLEVGAVDLAAVASESVETARPLAEEKDVSLTLATGPVPLMAGDRGRVAQLLDNLVSNAIKFTPEGGRVDVRLRGIDGDAVVEVRDTGFGIPADEQHRLFERFFRSSIASAQAIPGTGLGLAITKAIVEAHGGQIAVASQEGEGTTFKVTLPLGQPIAADLEAVEAAL
jgi:PAS domain S-box-containing protein